MALKFCIVSCGWNCEAYIERLISSLKAQTHPDFSVVLVNDCSEDGTQKQIDTHAPPEWTRIHLPANIGGFNAYDIAITTAIGKYDFDVLAFVGMDDYLEPNAIARTAEEYRNGKIHTYSAYQNNQGFIYEDLHYSDEIHQHREYRQDKYRCTGFVTFLKGMYPKIEFPTMGDIEKRLYYNLELSMSLLEMTGKERLGVIMDPIYRYNNDRLDNTANRYGRDLAVYRKIMSRPKRELYENS